MDGKKHRIGLLVSSLIAVLIGGCGAPSESTATKADGARATGSIALEVRPIDRYPGEKFEIDYKGTLVAQGRVAFATRDEIRVLPADDTGQPVIADRVRLAIQLQGRPEQVALSPVAGKPYFGTRLNPEADLPTTLSLTAEIDGTTGVAEILIKNLTPKAFD